MLREANGLPNQVLGVAFRRLPPKLVDRIAFATRSLLIGDLSEFGLPKPDHKIYETHPIVNSQLVYHVGHGDIQPVPDVARFERKAVVLPKPFEELDGMRRGEGTTIPIAASTQPKI